MSQAATEDMLRQACTKVGRLDEPDWKSHQLQGDAWGAVSKAMVKVLDELKGHGVGKPLSKLQELAFEQSLESPGDRSIQTVALWLTDSRLWLEKYIASKDAGLREMLERRGLVKPKEATG